MPSQSTFDPLLWHTWLWLQERTQQWAELDSTSSEPSKRKCQRINLRRSQRSKKLLFSLQNLQVNLTFPDNFIFIHIDVWNYEYCFGSNLAHKLDLYLCVVADLDISDFSNDFDFKHSILYHPLWRNQIHFSLFSFNLYESKA